MNKIIGFIVAGMVFAAAESLGAPFPAETNVLIQSGVYPNVPGASWKYHNLGIDLQTAWREVDFNDTAWASGNSQLGNGDGDEVTIIDIGPAEARYPTVYFRHTFTIADLLPYTNMVVRLLRDDGGVVYLNGVEVFRSRMPTGQEITYNTWATAAASGGDELTNFYAGTFVPTMLRNGENVIAVEIHQSDAGSSDLSFDLQLLGITVPSQGPAVVVRPPTNCFAMAGSNAVFSVVAMGAQPLHYQWQFHGTNINVPDSPWLVLANVQSDDAGLYSVIVSNDLGSAIAGTATLTVKPQPLFDLGRDFWIEANPNGPWTYGYQTNLGDVVVPFTFPSQEYISGGALIDIWGRNTSEPSRIYHNASPVTGTSDGGQGVYPPGTVWVLPGLEGRTDNYGVIRLTIPPAQSGTYEFVCSVASQFNGNLSKDSEFHLFKNGLEAFCRFMDPNSSATYSNLLHLRGGDTLDFVVGRGADNRLTGSGLKVQTALTLVTTNPIAPAILVQPVSQVGTLGSKVTFSVLAHSSMETTYQWQRNGIAIPEAVEPSLILTNLQPADAGSYSVMIFTKLGQLNSSNAMLVLKPQAAFDLTRDYSWSSNPTSAWAYGWSGELGAALNLFTTPTNLISENGVLCRYWTDPGRTAQLFANTTEFAATSDNGQGFYPPGSVWLVPGVEGGNDNYTISRFTVPPGGSAAYQLFVLGQSILTGSSSSDCDFHILKNGLEVFGEEIPARSGTTYSHIVWFDAGDTIDFAVGRGADGHATNSGLKFEITLNPVPVEPIPLAILAPPQNRTVAVGDTVTFAVAANGTGPLSYQWSGNGLEISGATNSVLRLENVTTNHIGTYKVVIADAQGSVLATKAILTVLDFATGFADNFEPSFDPLVWSSYGGTVIANTNAGSVSGSNSLWFGGSGARFITTRALNTQLGGAVAFYLRLANANYIWWDAPELPGDGVVFEYSINNGASWIVVSRYDTSSYMAWGSQIVDIPIGAQTTNTYFRWRQLNNGGSSQDHWALDNVQFLIGPAAPIVVEHPQSTYAPVGGSVTFKVGAIGSKPLYYQWRTNGVDVPSLRNASFTLNNVKTNYAMRYSVVVSNSLGVVVSEEAQLTVYTMGETFQILSLGTNATTIDVNNIAGDDRGGIALSESRLFVTGDSATAWFSVFDLSAGGATNYLYDSLVCDLQSETLYSLGNGTNIIPHGGGIVTSLLEIDSSKGALTGKRIDLTMSIPTGIWNCGIYSGFGRIALHNGSRAYQILLPSGIVIDMGAMAVPSHVGTESWANWGVAEYFSGSLYLTYVQNSRTISRARVPDGQTSTVASFSYLGDMASITVCPYLDRWYFRHEGSSQLGTGSEVVGFADASFTFSGSEPPSISYQPTNQAVLEGGAAQLALKVRGARPLGYQWFFKDQPIPGATSSLLKISHATTNDSGFYTVRISNAFGATISSNIMLSVIGMGPEFQILSLGKSGASTIDHEALTGDDRGGIALSGSQVFVTGDNNTARFEMNDLAGGVPLGRIYDGFVSDLRTEKVYVLGNGQTPLTRDDHMTLNTLLELNSGTGELTGNSIPLSSSINLGWSTAGIFSGYGRIAIVVNARAYHILMPYGVVVDLGSVTEPSHTYSESWAYWGVAEYFEGSLYIAYVRNSSTISRTRLPDGLTTPIASLGYLGDMASFTVAPYWDRWYFHHEGSSDLGSGSEIVGFADATFTFSPDPVPPTINLPPKSQPVLIGGNFTLRAIASGARPFRYQWLFNGNELDGQTNATLTLTGVTTNDAGAYAVRISNDFGSSTSSSAQITVLGWGEEFQITSLTSNNAQVVEIYDLTGYRLGPIGASSQSILYSGNDTTAAFDLQDLSNGTGLGRVFESLVSDLRSERLYSLALGTNLMENYYNTRVNTLIEHDPVTSQLTSHRIALTESIPFTNYHYGDIGFFSGYDRIVVHTGERVYMILMPSSLVVDLGPMAIPEHSYTGTWAYWGVAEYFNGSLYIVYVRDRQTIVRTRVPDGETTVVGTFEDLSYYMGSFTVSVYLNRWYFQHMYNSQFRQNGNSTLGFADATFAYTDGPRPPEIVSQPASQHLSAGSYVRLSVGATGTRPLMYQWRFNDEPLPNETNAVLLLQSITPEQGGVYSVVVSNAFGQVLSSEALLQVHELEGGNFQIAMLTTNNVYTIEHGQITGDSRSALATSGTQIFYSGDDTTAPFSLGDLSAGSVLNRIYDSLVSNLRTETVYSLGNGTNPIPNGGGIINTLLEHDPETGLPNGNQIELSSPIEATGGAYAGTVGLFSGYDRIVIHTGSRVYNISLPSGQVHEIGTMPPLTHEPSQSWAYWGIAEFVDGVVSLVYVRDSRAIVRTRVPDGLTTPVAVFENLGSMGTFTVSIYLNRWYFHHPYNSQFRSGDETLGFADATFNFDAPPQAPVFVGQPSHQTVSAGSVVRFSAIAKGTAPLFYQWYFNGIPIDGASGPDLVLNQVSINDAGRYSVVVSNDLGNAVSEEGVLNIFVLPGEPFQIIELSTNNFYVVEHRDVTGYQRSSLAASSNRVFYTGESGTASFDITDLGDATTIGMTNNAMVSDLKSGIVYSLANGDTVLPNGGGTLTKLLEHDSLSGALNGRSIWLSSAIPLSGPTYSGHIGIFAGYGRIVVHNGSRVYDIALPSGTVTEIGTMSPPPHQTPAGWAYWGVAEFADGVIWLVHVQDYYRITRTRVPDGLSTVIAEFQYLGNMSTITVAPALGRWYFQHPYSSQFTQSGDQTLGFADADFSVATAPTAPSIVIQPRPQTVLQEQPVKFQVWATGTKPLSYQWQFNGKDIPGATNSIYSFTNALTAHAGEYSVLIANEHGNVLSQPALLKVWNGLLPEKNFRITALTTNNPKVVEHYPITSSDRGGIAVSPDQVFFTGYNGTARFQASDLNGGTNMGVRYEAFVSNLRTETVYLLAHGNVPVNYGGGTVTSLLEMDNTTGLLTGKRIDISRPITIGYSSGFFAGYDCIAIYSSEDYHAYLIDLPSGDVIDLGYDYFYAPYSYWAYWGVAEQFDNAIWLTYVRDTQTIVRQRFPDGQAETISSFSNLGSMYMFTLSTSRARWYFHYRSQNQFGGTNATIGFADASWDYPPSISGIPTQILLEDTPSGEIPFVLFDSQFSANDLALTVASGNTNLVPVSNIYLQGTGSNRTVRIVPAPNLSGSANITLTVSNAAGLTGKCTFLVNVLSVNDPPSFELTGTEHTCLEDASLQYVLNWATNISVGPSNEYYYTYQSAAFAISNDNPGLFSSPPYLDPYSGGLSYMPATDAFGTATVTVYLRDTGGTNNGGINVSPSRQFTITVLPVNDAPRFMLSAFEHVCPENAGLQTVPGWAQIIHLPANESDQTLTFVVTTENPGLFSSLPAINENGTLTYQAVANLSGDANVTVVLCDDGGTENGGNDTSIVSQFMIRVQPVNDPPTAIARVWSPTLLRSNALETVILSPNGSNAVLFLDGSLSSDPESDPLTFYWWENGATNVFAMGVVVSNVIELGDWPIVLGVTDGNSLSTNLLFVRVLTAVQAVEELLGKVNDTSLNRKDKKFLVDKLKQSMMQFDREHLHAGIQALRQFRTKLLSSLAETHPDLVQDLKEGVDQIIYALEGYELVTARQELDTMLALVNNAVLVHKEKKPLLDKVKQAMQEYEKGKYDPALSHALIIQTRAQYNIKPIDETLGAELYRLAVDVAEILADAVNNPRNWEETLEP